MHDHEGHIAPLFYSFAAFVPENPVLFVIISD
jgi:hypothetical protein